VPLDIETQILYLCSRQDFNAQHQERLVQLCRTPTLRWDQLLHTARIHSVTPLLYHNLSILDPSRLNIPQETFESLEQEYQKNLVVRQTSRETLQRVFSYLAGKSIEVLLVKGEALSLLVYDQPWYLKMADVDLVIKLKRSQTDPKLIKEISTFIETINPPLSEGYEQIEFDFFRHHDVTMNDVLPVDFERIWRDAQPFEHAGHQVYLMSIEDLLIASAINACRKRFFRLKSLFDIAEITRRSQGLQWETFIEKSAAYQANAIVYTALLLAQTTLGCAYPTDLLDRLDVNPLRRRIIDRLVQYLSQNFSLYDLTVRSDLTILGRKFSRTLMLTYASYRWNQVGRKMAEVYRNRNNTHGWNPQSLSG
jgi:hypothetical protein